MSLYYPGKFSLLVSTTWINEDRSVKAVGGVPLLQTHTWIFSTQLYLASSDKKSVLYSRSKHTKHTSLLKLIRKLIWDSTLLHVRSASHANFWQGGTKSERKPASYSGDVELKELSLGNWILEVYGPVMFIHFIFNTILPALDYQCEPLILFGAIICWNCHLYIPFTSIVF